MQSEGILEQAPAEENPDELALVKEFAGIEHAIPYLHYVDQTPVGLILQVIQELPGQLGGGAIAFISLVLLILVVIFPKTLIILLFFVMALFGMTWIAASMLTRNTAVKADYSGISFPLIFLLSMKGELDRHWSEIRDITFTKYDLPSYDPTSIVFRFHGGGSASFLIDGFTRTDLERLLLVINTYCPKAKIRPELSELSGNLIAKGKEVGALSFTELWQAELGMRFGSTAFVPHESGDKLRDGEIRIIGQVAFGGLSAVYLAERKGKGTVILKEAVLPESADDVARNKCLALFEREAGLLAKIDHPRIASVYDSFVEDRRHYLVLEHIEGRNLRTYVCEFGPQPVKTALLWAEEIAEVLYYLHGLQPPVIHRDLTPDNMIVSKDGGITVIDFGAANDFLGTVTGTVVGKNAYIPLEQFRGKATPQSDIYAFGGTLFFLLTGLDPEPFAENSPKSIVDSVSDSIDQLVRDCMKVEKSERLPDCKTLITRLKQVRTS